MIIIICIFLHQSIKQLINQIIVATLQKPLLTSNEECYDKKEININKTYKDGLMTNLLI